MPAITDPQIVRWVNEKARPFSEQLLVLLLQSKEFVSNYDEKIVPLIAAAGHVGMDAVDDGRDAEGISRLLASDITALLSVANGLNNLATPAVFTTVRKPTVRSIDISAG